MLYKRDYQLGLTENEEQQYKEVTGRIFDINSRQKMHRKILNFIKDNEYYHIIGSLIWGLTINTGNHGVYLFPEFQLGNLYKADYLIMGKSSGGYEFILVEKEDIIWKYQIKMEQELANIIQVNKCY